MTVTQAPLAWIATLENALTQAKRLEPTPPTFAFPWDKATSALANSLALPDLQLKAGSFDWKEPQQILSGLGETPHLTSIDGDNLSGSLLLALPQDSVAKLVAMNLSPIEKFSDPSLQEGYTRFLLLNILEALDSLSLMKTGSFRLASESSLPEEGAYALDLTLTAKGKNLSARLLVPKACFVSFQNALKLEAVPLLETEEAKALTLTLALDIGYTTLSLEEWRSVKSGDLLLLDRCSFDLDTHTGEVRLSLERLPLVTGKVSGSEITLESYVEETTMTEPTPPTPAPALETPQEKEQGGGEPLLTAEKVPLTLTVEVGRIEMPLEEVLALKAGATLDLKIKPEEGVTLTLNGRAVARGELVKVGETLGVRIT